MKNSVIRLSLLITVFAFAAATVDAQTTPPRKKKKRTTTAAKKSNTNKNKANTAVVAPKDTAVVAAVEAEHIDVFGPAGEFL